MGKHTQSIDNKTISRIYGHGNGWVFTPAHFSDLGSRDAVASALRRYRQSGLIRQLARGLYDYPDGRSRTVRIGKKQIILKRTTPRNMATAGRISGLVIQALRHLGRQHVDDDIITRLDGRLDADAGKQLLKDVRLAPAWIADIMRRLGKKKETEST
jgi:hypothetical protein